MTLKLQFALFLLLPVLSFAQCPTDAHIELNSQAEVDSFTSDYPSCTSFITGYNFIISGPDIIDLSPLSSLTYVTRITIENNPLLTSLDGLDNLQSNSTDKTDLHIIDNPTLTDVSALQGLTACGNIDIINNDQLANLDGLSSITYMGIETLFTFPFHWLDISDNDNLTNINGLANLVPAIIDGVRIKNNPSLTSLQGLEEFRIFNSLEIENNDALIDFTGLHNLKFLYVGFNITDNDAITSLNEFVILEKVANFSVEGNDMLTSLNGLGEITDWYSISIIDNPSLTDISVIENFPEDFTNQLNISGNTSLAVCNYSFICNWATSAQSSNVQATNNAEGCSSIADIISECTVCPDNSVSLVFNSQQDIDNYFVNYPNCTTPETTLIIEGDDITNLDGLNGITSVGGLWLQNNPLLTNVDGLNSLTNFTDFGNFLFLIINNNPLLTNLSALINATNDYPMDIQIVNNPQLVSLNGLQGIQGVGYTIVVSNNDLLVDFNGFNGFTNIDDLIIKDNAALASFNGLDNLGITGSFEFENNDAMTSFTSLNDVNPLCGFTIRDNEMLADIDGFVDTFEDICGPNIIIENNPNLSVCNINFVCSTIPYLNSFFVSNNGDGCNSTYDVSNACEIPPFNDDITCSNYYGMSSLVLGETVMANNNYATASTYSPFCNDNANRQDIWFLLNLDSSVVINIEVTTGFSIQLWEGSCSALTQVSGACAQNILEDVSIVANTPYFLQVWSDDLEDRSANSTTLGDFEITVQDATLSLSDNSLEDFKVYPNPFKDELSLSHNRKIDQVYIYDLLGKRIAIKPIDAMHATLNLSEYESGVYFLKVFSGNATITKKIIKQ